MDNEYIDKEAAEQKQAKKEQVKSKKSVKRARQNMFVQVLNGEFLTKEFVLNNLNYIFFFILLLLLSVGKGYYGKNLSKEVLKSQEELEEISGTYVEVKAKLEEDTRRFKLIEKLEKEGLHETVNPTKVIRVKK
jgi:hypothetical protein